MHPENKKQIILNALKAHKNPDKFFYTSYEVANALSVSKSTVMNMVKEGKLKPYRITGKENEAFRFHIDDIISHLVEVNSN